MPLLPAVLREHFAELGLDEASVTTLIDEPNLSAIVRYVQEGHDKKTAHTIANWCLGELTRRVNDSEISWQEVADAIPYLVQLASMVDEAKVSSTAAKELLINCIKKKKDPLALAKELDLLQVSDESELVLLVEQVLSQQPQAVNDVKNGEIKVIGFLVGQVMKASKGKANPGAVQKLIKDQLGV